MIFDTGDTGHVTCDTGEVTGEYLLLINDNHLFLTVQTPSYNLHYTLYLVVLIAIHYRVLITSERQKILLLLLLL